MRSHNDPCELSFVRNDRLVVQGTNSNFMPTPVLAVKSFDSSTRALRDPRPQHSVIVLPVPARCQSPLRRERGNKSPHETRSALIVWFITRSLPVGARHRDARLSYPLECFEQSDTVLTG